MFHFADLAPYYKVSGMLQKGCPIRIPSDQSLFAATRRISLLTASFIADRCHGILHMLLRNSSRIHRCLIFSCQYSQGNFCLLLHFLVEMIGFEPTTYGLQSHRSPTEPHPHVLKMVGRGGFEPPTSRLSAACSNQLSYRPLTDYSV